MIYFPMHGLRRHIPVSRRVRRARRGLDAAVRTGRVFHLWFHPTNLADEPEAMFRGLRDIFSAVRESPAREGQPLRRNHGDGGLPPSLSGAMVAGMDTTSAPDTAWSLLPATSVRRLFWIALALRVAVALLIHFVVANEDLFAPDQRAYHAIGKFLADLWGQEVPIVMSRVLPDGPKGYFYIVAVHLLRDRPVLAPVPSSSTA